MSKQKSKKYTEITSDIINEFKNSLKQIQVAVINKITGAGNHFYSIQPDRDLMSGFGNGWKAVWRWCEEHKDSLYDYLNNIDPKLDLLIIQMDGDVCRKEKEVHCYCQRKEDECPPEIQPLFCEIIKEGTCPIRIPCPNHVNTVDAFVDHLSLLIGCLLGEIQDSPVCIVIPCDSSDTWVIAACEEQVPGDGFETVINPWEAVACHSAEYHGVRIKNRPKKLKTVYDSLIELVSTQWELVTQRCLQAKRLDQAIREYLEQ